MTEGAPTGWVHPKGDAPVAATGIYQLHSKSMPRSGHHLLVTMLAEYYGHAFAYCPFYTTGPWCCKVMPCSRPLYTTRHNRVHMQKSHDFEFKDPSNLSLGMYVIQHRNFVPRLQSNYDHWIHIRTDRADTMDTFRSFAKSEMRYHIRFWERWLARSPINSHVLRYEELAIYPQLALRALIESIDGSVDADRIEKASAVISAPSSSSLQKSGQFEMRDFRAHRHFNEPLLRDLESEVFTRCPGLQEERLLS